MPANHVVQLNRLKDGMRGKIVRIDATGFLLRRLLAMGFTRGSEIEVVKRAPLRDPIQIKLRRKAVSLRKREAEKVMVEVTG